MDTACLSGGMVRTRWSSLCSLKAGTGCCTLVTLKTAAELPAWRNALPAPPGILGKGTNMVGSDNPHSGTIIRLAPKGEFTRINPLGEGYFEFGCAWPWSRLLEVMAVSGWGGCSDLAGIPGSLGGALAMNAGALGSQISQRVKNIRGWDWSTGQVWQWEEGSGGWGYRHSPIPASVLALSATLRLEPVEPAAEQQLLRFEKRRRREVTPAGASAGSVFCNPPGAPPAGALLEQAGCKGLSAGVFTVSSRHTNWIVNCSRRPGRAEDCRILVAEMRSRVQQKFAIDLRCEWRWQD